LADVLQEDAMKAFRTSCLSAFVAATLIQWVSVASGQLINVQAPYQRMGDNFYDRTGVSFNMFFPGNNRIFGFNGASVTPNITVTQGSAATALPPFGGYDPNGDLRTGILYNGGDFGFGLTVAAGKGNTRSLVSNSPSVTMFNGQSASIFDGETRPFVTSIGPGSGASTGVGLLPIQLPRLHVPSRIDQPISSLPPDYSRPESTAGKGSESISSIRNRKAAEKAAAEEELAAQIDQEIRDARAMVDKGSLGAASIKYRRALRWMGENGSFAGLRETVEQELADIKDKK
jgi:hypothetical protein